MSLYTTRKCECEHEAHFSHGHTPNNNPAHKYGVYFTEHFIVAVATPFGTFHVCKDCADDCYREYVEQAKPVVRVRPFSEVKQEWIDKYGDKEDI